MCWSTDGLGFRVKSSGYGCASTPKHQTQSLNQALSSESGAMQLGHSAYFRACNSRISFHSRFKVLHDDGEFDVCDYGYDVTISATTAASTGTPANPAAAAASFAAATGAAPAAIALAARGGGGSAAAAPTPPPPSPPPPSGLTCPKWFFAAPQRL